MPIFLKNVASAYRGLAAPTGSIVGRINTLVDDYLAKAQATSEFGAIDDPNVYQSLIDLLQPYAGNAKIQAKIDNLLADKKQLETKMQNVVENKSFIDNNLNDALLQIAKNYYNNPQALIMKTAELYNAAKDQLDNEIIPRAIRKVGVGNALPADILNYQKQINDKATDMLRLYNSYVTGTGPQNPDAYGVFIQTNPDNGLPVSVQVKPVSSLDPELNGYIKTNNVRYGTIPVYLNTENIDGKEVGRLIVSSDKNGNPVSQDYTYNKDSKMLEGSRPNEKSIFGINWFESAATKLTEQALDWSNLKQFGADYVGIPANSVMRDSQNNYYYMDNSGKTSKALSKESMGAYLQQIGKNKEDVNNRAYLINADFLKLHPWQETGTDGKTVTRMINSNWSGGIGPIGPPAPAQQQLPKEAAAVELPAGPTNPVGYTGNFKSTTSTSLKKEQPPKEYVGGQYDFKSLMEKGKNLFKSFIPKF